MSTTSPKYILGVDLGQVHDSTAISILRKSVMLDAEGNLVKDAFSRQQYTYLCGYLNRFALSTPYPIVVREVCKLAREKSLDSPLIVVDAGGVGRGVIDLLVSEKMPGRLVPITITGGDTSTKTKWNDTGIVAYRVPKHLLVSAVQINLQNKTLKVVPTIEHAAILKSEMENFRIRVTIAGNELYNAREGKHDDILLATALALWAGENLSCEMFSPGQGFAIEPDPWLASQAFGMGPSGVSRYDDPVNRRNSTPLYGLLNR